MCIFFFKKVKILPNIKKYKNKGDNNKQKSRKFFHTGILAKEGGLVHSSKTFYTGAMEIKLKNSVYQVTLNTHGAEITSFTSVKDGTSYVFDGPSSVWKYHAPVLFPHVGRIRDGFMTYRESEYKLVNNGISRDLEHNIMEQTEDSATFELTESDATADKFPWKFSLKTHYQLKEDGLIFTTTVTNTDSSEMLFSIGSHTAFNCPRNTDPEGTLRSDYQYEFEKPENVDFVCFNDAAQLACDEEGTAPVTKPCQLVKDGIVAITEEGFGNGVMLTKFSSSWMGLRNKKDGSLIKVNCAGYPYLVMWQGGKGTKDGWGFNCIEPWYGIPDAENTDHDWEKKAGLIELKPGESFTADQSITIEDPKN